MNTFTTIEELTAFLLADADEAEAAEAAEAAKAKAEEAARAAAEWADTLISEPLLPVEPWRYLSPASEDAARAMQHCQRREHLPANLLGVGNEAQTAQRSTAPTAVSGSSPRTQRIPVEQLSPSRTQLSPSRTQLSPSRTQLSPSRTQLSPSRTQLSPSRTQLSPSRTQLSPSRTQLSPSRTQISPSRTQLSPSGTQLSPSGTQLSPSGTQLSPSRTQLSPSRTQLSPSRTQLSPSRTQLSPSRTQQPLLLPSSLSKAVSQTSGQLAAILIENEEADKEWRNRHRKRGSDIDNRTLREVKLWREERAAKRWARTMSSRQINSVINPRDPQSGQSPQFSGGARSPGAQSPSAQRPSPSLGAHSSGAVNPLPRPDEGKQPQILVPPPDLQVARNRLLEKNIKGGPTS